MTITDAMIEAAFLVALAEAKIPPDVGELLVRGNPALGVAPGALRKALEAAERVAWRPIEDVVEPLLLQVEHCLTGFRIGKQDITAAMNVLGALAITARMSIDRAKEGVS